MNLQYYFNYVTIVEEGSLTAASRKLHIAQPALSNQIKAMEQKYGTRLFFRGARRLELTDAGMILYQKAKRMCEIEQAAKNEIASGFTGHKGAYELRKICIDHVYQKYGAEMAVSISGDDIRTITRYYADPSRPNIGTTRIIDLL